MATIASNEVERFVADLDARMSEVENSRLDEALGRRRFLCIVFVEGVKAWGREIFSGRSELDPKDESELREAGGRLLRYSRQKLNEGLAFQGPSLALRGLKSLEMAVGELRTAVERLAEILDRWVTPRISLLPGARLGVSMWSDQEIDEARERIAVALDASKR